MTTIKISAGQASEASARARAATERIAANTPSPSDPVNKNWGADARAGNLLRSRFGVPTKPNYPLPWRFYANTVNEKLDKWDTAIQKTMPADTGKPFVLNPLARGSQGTWRGIREYGKRLRDPAYAQAARTREATTAIQNRMRADMGRLTTDRTRLDMGDPSDRIRAGPDFLHRNPIFHDYKPRTVWGMQPATINGLVNLAGRAIGLPTLTQPYASRMPSLYPAGNRNYPVSDMDLLGMGEYMNTLGGPSRKTVDLAGAAAQYIR
jgi:hypothetical protein